MPRRAGNATPDDGGVGIVGLLELVVEAHILVRSVGPRSLVWLLRVLGLTSGVELVSGRRRLLEPRAHP